MFASECIQTQTMNETGSWNAGLLPSVLKLWMNLGDGHYDAKKQRIMCGFIPADDVLFEWEEFPLCDTLNDLELYNR